MGIPSGQQPVEPDPPGPHPVGEKHLAGNASFRPFPTWVSVLIAVLVLLLLLYLMR